MVKKGISSSTLKFIAMITMLIDHIGAVILEPMMVQGGFDGLIGYDPILYNVNFVLRMVIGRVAFPIYCFLLVEGVKRTSDVCRYGVRLLLAALASEVPFDLALNGVWLESSYQNVVFTLLVGFLVMVVCNKIEEKKWNRAYSWTAKILVLVLGMCMADGLHTDYGGYGVLCIAVLYFFGRNAKLQIMGGSVAFVLGDILIHGGNSELFAPLGLAVASFYDGRKGLKMQYLFYAFYPVHLFLLYIVRMILS